MRWRSFIKLKKVKKFGVFVEDSHGIDPTIVRIIWGICACLWGVGILAYIVCAIAMPNKSEVVGNNGEYTVNSTEKKEDNDNNNENKN